MDFREFLSKKDEIGPIISLKGPEIHYDYVHHQFIPNKGVHQGFAKTISSNGGSQPANAWQPIFSQISLWK